ncbi:hypothetical protein IW150_003223, partial [Coemansia sp. RSA 2607]
MLVNSDRDINTIEVQGGISPEEARSYIVTATQVAYLLHLADTATSEQINTWTPENIDELVAWARHADLIMPTLSAEDRSAVLLHATKIQPSNDNTLSVIERLKSSQSCLSALLMHVITNPSAPDKVRVAAIHKTAEDIREQGMLKDDSNTAAVSMDIASRFSQTLLPLQHAWRIAKINSVLASTILRTRQDSSSTEVSDSIIETEYLVAPGTSRIISIALALLHAVDSAAPPAIEQMAAEMFRETQSSELHNAALFAALHTKSSALQHAIITNICSHFTPSSKATQEQTIRFFISLDSHLLAKLCLHSESFGCKYLAQLIWMNKCCQLAMLGEYIGQASEADMLAGSDKVVAGLVD